MAVSALSRAFRAVTLSGGCVKQVSYSRQKNSNFIWSQHHLLAVGCTTNNLFFPPCHCRCYHVADLLQTVAEPLWYHSLLVSTVLFFSGGGS